MFVVVQDVYKKARIFITHQPYEGILSLKARKNQISNVYTEWKKLVVLARRNELIDGQSYTLASPYQAKHALEAFPKAGLIWKKASFLMYGYNVLGEARQHMDDLRRLGWRIDIPPPDLEKLIRSGTDQERREITVILKKSEPEKYPVHSPVYR